MLTTKNIKLKEGEIPGSVKIVTTNKLKPKEFSLDPNKWGGINKRETKKTLGSMLTTANYKDRVEASKPKPKKKKRARRKAKK